MSLAARLRHSITFEQKVIKRNAHGLINESWEVVHIPGIGLLKNIPAQVLTGPGRDEFQQAGQTQSEVVARITLRWFPGGINPAWRIIWDNQILNILGLPETDVTARREYRIKCRAGVGNGG